MRGERVERAVARAFGGTFVFLLVTAVIGFGLAWMLSGHTVPAVVFALPAAHANLGTLGWLSLLIFGVSMRTLRPITGEVTNFRWMHIVVGSLAVLGVPILAAGVASNVATLTWIGAVLFVVAALGYAFDTLDRVRRARNPHRPPQAFVVAGVLWFLASLALGAGVLLGKPWQQAYGFLLLMGWVGQFVNAHLYHIGIRLLATVYRGEEDETRPQELLEARLSWYSFFAFQIAIAAVAVALVRDDASLVARGAIFGITGWIAMIANVLAARTRAKILPKTIILR
jgi:predicted membrane channel-forming protein YqfA (hemolysin III family)